ncbi:MAG: AzlD domain-containing protein [Acutalibacteraceae bacterium]|nr:AzlD domain-containing protein [Acutalibacteraceae bacterium]
MSVRPEFALYLLVMAGVTYLIRMIPMVLIREKIKNRFILSFLYYVPYAVLSAMVIPAIFYASGNIISAAIGFVVAVVAAFFGRGLVTVATLACVSVFITELVMKFLQ